MEIIKSAFEKLLVSENIDNVNSILTDLQVDQKYQMDDQTYPHLEFKITEKEINELRREKILNDENLITDVSNQNTLTKLLYAVAWKNGDLKKIRHIVEGIESTNDDDKENALVFYQFGKYLTKKPGEPIIDQHVLRAYGIFKALEEKNELEVERLTKLSVVTKKEKGLIEGYKNWLKKDLHEGLRNCENYAYHVDKVLFAVGKKVKSENNKKARAANKGYKNMQADKVK